MRRKDKGTNAGCLPPSWQPEGGAVFFARSESGGGCFSLAGHGNVVMVCGDGREIVAGIPMPLWQPAGQAPGGYCDAEQSIREQERAHIARELHDDLGQQLMGIRLGVSALMGELRRGWPQMAERWGVLAQQVDAAIASVRRIGAGLRPLMLDDLGLYAAVEWLADDVQGRTGLHIEVELDDENGPELDDRVSSALFRIVQESLHNVVRHAQASRVRIMLAAGDEKMWLRVRDDGVGVQGGASFCGGEGGERAFGLMGIRERVCALGGEVRAGSRAGRGFMLEVWVPVKLPAGEGGA